MKAMPRRARAGFSLIEALVACALLPIGLSAAFYLIGQSTQVSRSSEVATMAATYALQVQMNQEALIQSAVAAMPQPGDRGPHLITLGDNGTLATTVEAPALRACRNPACPGDSAERNCLCQASVRAGPVNAGGARVANSVELIITVPWKDNRGARIEREFRSVVSTP